MNYARAIVDYNEPIRVYLAGGMESGWQEILKDSTNACIFYDPRDSGLKEPLLYTNWDLKHVKKCDVIFIYIEKDNPSGIGLSVEIGYAKALGKHIILVDEKEDDKRFDIVRACAYSDYTTNVLPYGIDHLMQIIKKEI